MRVLFVAAECYPLAKTGGLGDVAAALPRTLREQGLDVRLLLPGLPGVLAGMVNYRATLAVPPLPGGHTGVLRWGETPGGIPLYVLDAPALFDRPGSPYADPSRVEWPDNHLRFGALSFAAAHLANGWGKAWSPDLVHCNDWHTGLTPVYMRLSGNSRVASVLTIHNADYQGLFAADTFPSLGLPGRCFQHDGVEYHGRVGFLKAGVCFADRLTTVSPTYAREIQESPEGRGLEGLFRARSNDLTGILNGIDEELWDPTTDPHLAARYDAAKLSGKARNKQRLQREFGIGERDDLLLCAFVGRLIRQKGLDLVLAAASRSVAAGAQLAILGTGDEDLETALGAAAQRCPTHIGARIRYDEMLAHRLIGGADVILVPSRSEPCGLTQLYGKRYGTLPLVRNVGGLADTVIDLGEDPDGTGFVFALGSAHDLAASVSRAAALFRQRRRWRGAQRRAMSQRFGWADSASRYAELYRSAIAAKHRATPQLNPVV